MQKARFLILIVLFIGMLIFGLIARSYRRSGNPLGSIGPVLRIALLVGGTVDILSGRRKLRRLQPGSRWRSSAGVKVMMGMGCLLWGLQDSFAGDAGGLFYFAAVALLGGGAIVREVGDNGGPPRDSSLSKVDT